MNEVDDESRALRWSRELRSLVPPRGAAERAELDGTRPGAGRLPTQRTPLGAP